jgi:hypothetical protein
MSSLRNTAHKNSFNSFNSSLPSSSLPSSSLPSIGNGVLVSYGNLKVGNYYYYTILSEDTKIDGIEHDFSTLSFSYAGEYQGKKRISELDALWPAFKNYGVSSNLYCITPHHSGFYETNPEMEINRLPLAKEVIVTQNPVENGYYAVTDITSVIINQGEFGESLVFQSGCFEKNIPYYVGQHTGCIVEGWKTPIEQVFFNDDRRSESRGKFRKTIVAPTPTTAFYRVNPPESFSKIGKIKTSSERFPDTEYNINIDNSNLSAWVSSTEIRPSSPIRYRLQPTKFTQNSEPRRDLHEPVSTSPVLDSRPIGIGFFKVTRDLIENTSYQMYTYDETETYKLNIDYSFKYYVKNANKDKGVLVGRYLRKEQSGFGADSSDNYLIFMKDGEEVKIDDFYGHKLGFVEL